MKQVGTGGDMTRPRPATATLLRVEFFTSYIILSAERRIAWTEFPSSGKVARPKLPEMLSASPLPSRKRELRRRWQTSMVVAIAASLPIPGRSATNSSPP